MGSVTGKALLENGKRICGFIDKRAKDIRQCIGYPVYDIETLKKKAGRHAVIFVAVKNVFYHMDIAVELYANGFERIIYKSCHAIHGTMSGEEQLLDKAYELIYKTGDIPDFEIPIVLPKQEFQWTPSRILLETEEYVTLNAPLEQIYTGVTAAKWTNTPVLSLIPYIELFRYFEGDSQCRPDDYIALCEEGARSEQIEITDSWKQYALENRFHIFGQMRWQYEHEPEFFTVQAPEAAWDKRGYFRLLTGKHRICFLIAMGKTSAPLKIRKDTWRAICEDPKLHEIRQILERSPNAQMPLPHIYFQGNRQFHCIFYQKKLREIYWQMYKTGQMCGQERETLEIRDQTQDSGYFSLIFSQMGFCVYRDFRLSSDKNEIYQKLGMKISERADSASKTRIKLDGEGNFQNEND